MPHVVYTPNPQPFVQRLKSVLYIYIYSLVTATLTDHVFNRPVRKIIQSFAQRLNLAFRSFYS
jgi:hypothetical protein